jgi:hypothetical protein
MTVSSRLAPLVACALALTFVVAEVEPAFAKDPEPYNPAVAARKYCGRAFKRFCAKVPGEGVEAFNCLKQNVNRLPPNCRKAIQAL